MTLSVVHGLAVPAAVLGARLKIGVATLTHGGLHIPLALPLGRHWGLVDVARDLDPASGAHADGVLPHEAGELTAHAAVARLPLGPPHEP